MTTEPRHFQQCGMCEQQRLRSACAYAQSDQSLCWSLEHSMTVKLLTEHHLEVLSLSGGCTGSSESIHVKIQHCWKSTINQHSISSLYSISVFPFWCIFTFHFLLYIAVIFCVFVFFFINDIVSFFNHLQ